MGGLTKYRRPYEIQILFDNRDYNDLNGFYYFLKEEDPIKKTLDDGEYDVYSMFYKHEKLAFLPLLIATPVLFFSGGALVYFYVLPVAWEFFLSFE